MSMLLEYCSFFKIAGELCQKVGAVANKNRHGGNFAAVNVYTGHLKLTGILPCFEVWDSTDFGKYVM